jgi:hypothetical protein
VFTDASKLEKTEFDFNQSMNTTEIIALVISSSVLSAILTGFVNLRIHNLNFKREYFKKIIDKRIQAQEQIEALSSQLKIQIKLDNGTLCNSVCASGEDYFQTFCILVAASLNTSLWLSDELAGVLQDFNIFLLNEITHEINGNSIKDRNQSLIDLGIRHHEHLREFREKIEMQLMKDFATLSNVKAFIKPKRKLKDRLYLLKK